MPHRSLFRDPSDAERLVTLGVDGSILARHHETGGTYELVLSEFPAGFVLPPHRHPWAEFYLVLDGALDVSIGRQTRTLRPGGFAHVPPRAVHTIGTPESTCRAVLWTAGADALAMFEDMADNLPAGAPSEALIPRLIEITSRHGLQILAPGRASTKHTVLTPAEPDAGHDCR